MRNLYRNTLAMVASAAFAGGCSSMAGENTRTVAGSDSKSVVELQAAQTRVSELESEVAARDRKIADNEARLAQIGSSSSSQASITSLFPPNGKTG